MWNSLSMKEGLGTFMGYEAAKTIVDGHYPCPNPCMSLIFVCIPVRGQNISDWTRTHTEFHMQFTLFSNIYEFCFPNAKSFVSRRQTKD